MSEKNSKRSHKDSKLSKEDILGAIRTLEKKIIESPTNETAKQFEPDSQSIKERKSRVISTESAQHEDQDYIDEVTIYLEIFYMENSLD